jgi:hypothetical protein
MKSYLKIYGPPIIEAIVQLERIAVGMPKVCIWDTQILRDIPPNLARDIGGRAVSTTRTDWVKSYYGRRNVVISGERCQSIISSSGDSLGDYDFFYEWLEGPSTEQLKMLIEKIDDALEPLGCRYTITTKK